MAAPSPSTPSMLPPAAEERQSPAKRRRTRAAASARRLWLRTRWTALAGEDSDLESRPEDASFEQWVRSEVRDAVATVQRELLTSVGHVLRNDLPKKSDFEALLQATERKSAKENEVASLACTVSNLVNVVEKITVRVKQKEQGYEELVKDFGVKQKMIEQNIEKMLAVASKESGVLRAADLQAFKDEFELQRASWLERTSKIEERMAALESSAEREGFRRRLARVAEGVADLSGRVKELEEVVNAGDCDSYGKFDGNDFYDNPPCDEVLHDFRRQLVEGMPVHMAGLMSRAELNGCAGFLEKRDDCKGRWAIRIGLGRVLVKPANIVP